MRYAAIIVVTLCLIACPAFGQDWAVEDVFGEPAGSGELVPVVPGVPPPPNYYGVAGNSYRHGYTEIETETTKVDPYEAATGFMDPFYTERRIQVVPNNSAGQAIAPFRLAP